MGVVDNDPVWILRTVEHFVDERVREYVLRSKSAIAFDKTFDRPKGYWLRRLKKLSAEHMVDWRIVRAGMVLDQLPLLLGKGDGMLDKYVALRMRGELKPY